MVTIKASRRSLGMTYWFQIREKRTSSFPMWAGPTAFCTSAGIPSGPAALPFIIAPISEAVSSRVGGSSRWLFTESWGKFVIASLFTEGVWFICRECQSSPCEELYLTNPALNFESHFVVMVFPTVFLTSHCQTEFFKNHLLYLCVILITAVLPVLMAPLLAASVVFHYIQF